jgi:hypothetical protein
VCTRECDQQRAHTKDALCPPLRRNTACMGLLRNVTIFYYFIYVHMVRLSCWSYEPHSYIVLLLPPWTIAALCDTGYRMAKLAIQVCQSQLRFL